MRIAYLSTDFGVPVRGTKGASVHVRKMVGALAQRGHELVLLTPDSGEGPAEAPACRVVSLPFEPGPAALYEQLKREAICRDNRLSKDLRNVFYSLAMQAQALPLLSEFRPDFLYERYALFGTAGVQLARALGVPLLLEVNAPLVEEQREQRGLDLPHLAEEAERQVFGGADELLVVSRWLESYAREHGADPTRITVVPNAADGELFRPRTGPSEVRRRLGWETETVLGFVGAMKPWHGVIRLVEALLQLGGAAAPFRLLLLGDGPELERVRERVRTSGLERVVHAPGAVPHGEVPDWLAAVDLALVPYEPTATPYFSPVKLFEYMSMGLPIVAARLGQTEEILVHESTGWLY
ncbi:MAG: glycosyltransferase family 4 protein, partial [Planctomycetes bacterium]|nr:glycosyltransferase family 4 protein [Planctomycetota bacterium]